MPVSIHDDMHITASDRARGHFDFNINLCSNIEKTITIAEGPPKPGHLPWELCVHKPTSDGRSCQRFS